MQPILSIVIISMNNIVDLKLCLNTIYRLNNTNNYEIYIIAFNYKKSSLHEIYKNFPLVKIIETNGVKGFSENNNEALKFITGKYCLILNDDTFFEDNSIDILLDFITQNNDIKILSPKILNFDGSIQILGRPKFTLFSYILHELKLSSWLYVGDRSKELFQTYNISGACFMIETQLFKSLGFFDEKYFFTPEDIALSTKARRLGKNSYVLKKAAIYHKGSSTAKSIHQVTIPVAKQGIYLFFREFYGPLQEIAIRFFIFIVSILKLHYWFFFKKKSDRRTVMITASINCIKFSFRIIEPKKLFIKLMPGRL